MSKKHELPDLGASAGRTSATQFTGLFDKLRNQSAQDALVEHQNRKIEAELAKYFAWRVKRSHEDCETPEELGRALARYVLAASRDLHELLAEIRERRQSYQD